MGEEEAEHHGAALRQVLLRLRGGGMQDRRRLRGREGRQLALGAPPEDLSGRLRLPAASCNPLNSMNRAIVSSIFMENSLIHNFSAY